MTGNSTASTSPTHDGGPPSARPSTGSSPRSSSSRSPPELTSTSQRPRTAVHLGHASTDVVDGNLTVYGKDVWSREAALIGVGTMAAGRELKVEPSADGSSVQVG